MRLQECASNGEQDEGDVRRDNPIQARMPVVTVATQTNWITS